MHRSPLRASDFDSGVQKSPSCEPISGPGRVSGICQLGFCDRRKAKNAKRGKNRLTRRGLLHILLENTRTKGTSAQGDAPPDRIGGREGRRIRREPYQMPRRPSRFSTKREGGGALGAPSCPAHLLLLGTDEQVRVYGGGAVDASPHANGPGAAPKDHCGQADVLRDHDVSRLQGLHDGKVRRVGAGAHGQRVNPEAAPGMRGVARVSRPDVPLQVLRGVARNDHGHTRPTCHRERVSRDGTGVGVDEERHRWLASSGRWS